MKKKILISFGICDLENTLNIADIVILLVDHNEFKNIVVNKKWTIDTRGTWK